MKESSTLLIAIPLLLAAADCGGKARVDLTTQQAHALHARTTRLAVGRAHACALDSAGHMHCWGQLDKPCQPSCNVESECVSNGRMDCGQATAPTGTFTEVTAGYFHTCGLRADGTVSCWGLPAMTHSPAGKFVSVRASDTATCAVSTEGVPTCWGQFGNTSTRTSEVALAQADGSGCTLATSGTVDCGGRFKGAFAGAYKDLSINGFACAVTASGKLECPTPGFSIPATPTLMVEVHSQGAACALTQEHDVLCWGMG